MYFRSVAAAALFAAVAVSAADVKAGTGANVDGIVAADAGAELNVPGLKALPAIKAEHLPVVPSRRLNKHKRHGDLTVALDAHLAIGCNKIFVDLKVKVGPLIKKLEGLVEQVQKGAVEGVVDEVKVTATSLVTVLEKEGTGLLKGLVGTTTGGSASSKDAPSAQTVASPLASVYQDVAGVFQSLKTIESSVPGLGEVLSSVTTELQTTLSTLLTTVGQVAAPLLKVLKGLLGPVEGLLNELGLCPVTDLINSILGI